MPDPRHLTFFHSPNTRSTGVAILLEELGAPHQTHIINMAANEQRQPAYLAINPMGKVPALKHNDVVVTEAAAIAAFPPPASPQPSMIRYEARICAGSRTTDRAWSPPSSITSSSEIRRRPGCARTGIMRRRCGR